MNIKKKKGCLHNEIVMLCVLKYYYQGLMGKDKNSIVVWRMRLTAYKYGRRKLGKYNRIIKFKENHPYG